MNKRTHWRVCTQEQMTIHLGTNKVGFSMNKDGILMMFYFDNYGLILNYGMLFNNDKVKNEMR